MGKVLNNSWWSWGDSNSPPLQCECSALPNELQPHEGGLDWSIVAGFGLFVNSRAAWIWEHRLRGAVAPAGGREQAAGGARWPRAD